MAELEVNLEKKPLKYKNDKGEDVKVEVEGREDEWVSPFEDKFYGNLAEKLDKPVLGKLANDLVKYYEDDKSSRKNWEDQYSKGLKINDIFDNIIVHEKSESIPNIRNYYDTPYASYKAQFNNLNKHEVFELSYLYLFS